MLNGDFPPEVANRPILRDGLSDRKVEVIVYSLFLLAPLDSHGFSAALLKRR
jgi:hypothetical protein